MRFEQDFIFQESQVDGIIQTESDLNSSFNESSFEIERQVHPIGDADLGSLFPALGGLVRQRSNNFEKEMMNFLKAPPEPNMSKASPKNKG